jgi:glycosylphosphatidylinositol transamidase (GPIT) subunit GPI8
MSIFTAINQKSSIETMVSAIAKIHYGDNIAKAYEAAKAHGNIRHKATHIALHSVLCQQGINTVYMALKERDIHPDGTFDNKNRWYPSADEDIDITNSVRSPSAAWPYSYLTACRTKKHVKTLLEHSPELFTRQLQKANNINYSRDVKEAEKLSLLEANAINIENGNTHYYDPKSGTVLAIA